MTARKPRAYSGTGSAIDDYFKPNLQHQAPKTDNSPFGGWGAFKKNNPRHRLILSLCRQAQWTVTHEKWGEVADLDRLSNFLKSERSPVQKPLLKMDGAETEKIIQALQGIVKSKYK